MKNALTVAGFGIFFGYSVASHGESSVTLYGVIDESIQYVHNTGGHSNQIGLQSSQMSTSRWGIRGSEDLGGGTSAVFDLESQFDVNNGALPGDGQLFGRAAYVGLSRSDLGTLTFGRQFDVLQDIVVPVQGNNVLEFFSTPGDVDLSDGVIKINNAIKWLSPNWAGLQVGAMYAFGNVAGSVGSGQSYAAALSYTSGPVTMAAGYLHADNGNGTNQTRGMTTASGIFYSPVNAAYVSASGYNIARVGATYTRGSVTVGGYYSYAEYLSDGFSRFRNSERYNNVSVFSYWQATPAFSAEVGYNYLKSHGDSSAAYQQVTMTLDYMLGKRTDLYAVAGYGHASGENGSGPAQAVIADTWPAAGSKDQELVILGIRHRF